MLWQRAYEVKIWDAHRETVGRGPTPEAAQEAAERRWVAEAQRAHEDAAASRSNKNAE
jgi:hypothetical protein